VSELFSRTETEEDNFKVVNQVMLRCIVVGESEVKNTSVKMVCEGA